MKKEVCVYKLILKAENQLKEIDKTLQNMGNILSETAEALDHNSIDMEIAGLNVMSAQIESFRDLKESLNEKVNTIKTSFCN